MDLQECGMDYDLCGDSKVGRGRTEGFVRVWASQGRWGGVEVVRVRNV